MYRMKEFYLVRKSKLEERLRINSFHPNNPPNLWADDNLGFSYDNMKEFHLIDL